MRGAAYVYDTLQYCKVEMPRIHGEASSMSRACTRLCCRIHIPLGSRAQGDPAPWLLAEQMVPAKILGCRVLRKGKRELEHATLVLSHSANDDLRGPVVLPKTRHPKLTTARQTADRCSLQRLWHRGRAAATAAEASRAAVEAAVPAGLAAELAHQWMWTGMDTVHPELEEVTR